MLVGIDAPFVDTTSRMLSFAFGLSRRKALAVLLVECAGLPVELRLLGASHQVLAGPVSETVACLADRDGRLPERLSRVSPSWSYEFTAEVVAHEECVTFERTVAALLSRLADRDDALTGTFPGSPHALTALALASEPGLGWRSWHAYPQTREIVMTRSRLASTG